MTDLVVTATLDGSGAPFRVAATDLYLAVSGQTHAEVNTPGSVAVPAKDLRDRVAAMPDLPIHITTTESAQTTLKAVGAQRRYTLHGIPGSEFPQLPNSLVVQEVAFVDQ